MERRIISTDCETFPFQVGAMAPPPVCFSWAEGDDVGLVAGRKDIKALLKPMLEMAVEGEAMITGLALAYDFAVVITHYPELITLVCEAYERDAVVCVRVVEKLLDIATGRHMRWGGGDQYGLASIAKRRLKIDVEGKKGPDVWRLRYHELDGIPVDKWPKAAVDYSINDSVLPLKIFHNQHQRAAAMRYNVPDAFHQTRADLMLRITSMNGTRTDATRVRELVNRLESRMRKRAKKLIRMGLYSYDKKGKGKKSTTNLKALVTDAFGGHPPMTNPSKRFPNGQVKTDGDTLEDLYEVSPGLRGWVKFCEVEKNAGFARKLRPLMHSGYNVLVETGRTSSFGDKSNIIPGVNMQQLPREPGVRDCFKARKGKVLISCDYDSQELRTLAQCLLWIVGSSKLAERYQASPTFDPHTAFAAAELLKITEEEALCLKAQDDKTVLEARQSAKICNFGLPGGMGVRGLIKYARGYGERWAEPKTCKGCAPGADKRTPHNCRSEKLRAAWFRQWTEMDSFFKHVKSLVGHGGIGTLEQFVSERWRGMVGFTDGSNSYFQGLAADATKKALWEVGRRCIDKSMKSALYGFRLWAYIHDEIILEGPEERAHEAALELKDVMEKAMAIYTPDIPVRASAALMRFWKKGAKPKFNKQGRLIPIEDAE